MGVRAKDSDGNDSGMFHETWAPDGPDSPSSPSFYWANLSFSDGRVRDYIALSTGIDPAAFVSPENFQQYLKDHSEVTKLLCHLLRGADGKDLTPEALAGMDPATLLGTIAQKLD